MQLWSTYSSRSLKVWARIRGSFTRLHLHCAPDHQHSFCRWGTLIFLCIINLKPLACKWLTMHSKLTRSQMRTVTVSIREIIAPSCARVLWEPRLCQLGEPEMPKCGHVLRAHAQLVLIWWQRDAQPLSQRRRRRVHTTGPDAWSQWDGLPGRRRN